MMATELKWLTGRTKMRHLERALLGALLLIGVGAFLPETAAADESGTHYDSVCNCRRPDSEYTTRRVERAAPRVVTRNRYVNHTRVVRGNTRLVQENRLIVHVRPVINREVVVHRTNTIVKDLVLHKVNTVNRVQEVNRREVINRNEQGTVRHIVERREVRGTNCNCGYSRGLIGGERYSGGNDEGPAEQDDGDGGQVSYRN